MAAKLYKAMRSQTPVPPPPPVRLPDLPWPATVVAPKINIRSGPGIDCADVGDLLAGARPLVQDLRLHDGDLWGRIGDNIWCALVYRGVQYLEWVP